jgi:alpha-ketoglutaric semialdehyde dehydrogenase
LRSHPPEDQTGKREGASFRAVNPASAAELEPVFYSATSKDIDRAASLAEAAFPALAGLSGRERTALLRRIADGLASEGSAIAERLLDRPVVRKIHLLP